MRKTPRKIVKSSCEEFFFEGEQIVQCIQRPVCLNIQVYLDFEKGQTFSDTYIFGTKYSNIFKYKLKNSNYHGHPLSSRVPIEPL